jgi:opacity protein-like surface antigen
MMKNIVLSAAAVFAMSSFAIAGGDIAPIEEPVVEVPEVVAPTDNGFYLGLAYGYLNAVDDVTYGPATVNLFDDSYGEVMLQAGYKFNSYVAVEGRYWFGVSKGSWLNPGGSSSSGIPLIGDAAADLSFDAFGLYVKPMYPVTEAFNVYALLGYGSIDSTFDGDDNWEDPTSADGFSWGIGAEYAFNENVSIFIDYTSIYDSDEDTTVVDAYGNVFDISNDLSANVIDFGVTYKF